MSMSMSMDLAIMSPTRVPHAEAALGMRAPEARLGKQLLKVGLVKPVAVVHPCSL